MISYVYSLMVSSNSNKSLLLTLLLCVLVILMAFNIDIPRKNKIYAETFFEILEDDSIEEDKKEVQEGLTESNNKLNTNRAFNEHKKTDPFEDNEFKKYIKKIHSRLNTQPKKTTQKIKPKKIAPIEAEQIQEFNNINALIELQTGKEQTKSQSSISYFLANRTKIHIPVPVYLCEEGGEIVVNIVVNTDGKVTQASYNSSSTSTHGCLIDYALKYAKASLFEAAPSKKTQVGTITFLFKGKQ